MLQYRNIVFKSLYFSYKLRLGTPYCIYQITHV